MPVHWQQLLSLCLLPPVSLPAFDCLSRAPHCCSYYPLKALGIVALALFAAVTLVVFMIMVLKRRQWFMSIVVFTGVCECVLSPSSLLGPRSPMYRLFAIVSPAPCREPKSQVPVSDLGALNCCVPNDLTDSPVAPCRRACCICLAESIAQSTSTAAAAVHCTRGPQSVCWPAPL